MSLRDGRGYNISGWETTCKRCGKEQVFWYQTKAGKWILYDGFPVVPATINERDQRLLANQGNGFHNCQEAKPEQPKQPIGEFTNFDNESLIQWYNIIHEKNINQPCEPGFKHEQEILSEMQKRNITL